MMKWAAVIMAALSFTASSDVHAQNNAPAKTIHDYEVYTSGSWTGFIAPYFRGDLSFGRDYTESMTVNTNTFPNDTKMAWRWPKTPAQIVYGDNTVQFGDYDDTHPLAPIPSKSIGRIGILKVFHKSSVSGNLNGFDAIIDLFLTAQPGGASPHQWEIEVFLHTPLYAAEFVRGGRPVGSVSISGRMWTVAIQNSNDILFMPSDQGDVMSGSIDLKAIMSYAVQQGVIARSLYFNGFAYGIEERSDPGSININQLSVTYN